MIRALLTTSLVLSIAACDDGGTDWGDYTAWDGSGLESCLGNALNDHEWCTDGCIDDQEACYAYGGDDCYDEAMACLDRCSDGYDDDAAFCDSLYGF